VAVKIWGHTDGGPRPHQIELHLPDGQAADVAELVARKKVEVASAELHHARVKEKQLKQVYDEARERDLAAHTKQKLAEKQYQRASKDHSRTAKALSIAKSKQAKALEKTMERNQALQFASKKKKAKMADGVKLAQRAKAAADTAVDTATGKAAKASDKLRDASRTKKHADDKAFKTHLDAVSIAVKLRAAKEHREKMEYEQLKSKNLQKLSVSKRVKERSRKKLKQALKSVKHATNWLKMMDSKEGKASATRALTKAKGEEKEFRTKYNKARKEVAETTAKMRKSEVDYTKKAAYKSYISAAKASEVAANADKAFTSALSDADKQAKKQAAREAQQVLRKADAQARKSMATLEHVKFKNKQEETAQAEELKADKALQKEKAAEIKKRKKDIALTKKALKGFGKPPKR